ncbi:MAG: HDOD domain-containing protein [Burkholderiales bacterium]|nr:HDOD domain-containing protein [Burkholderiales bacterium]MDE2455545.1 HDOD domain-containing protein [Burkholderiales bacterium]
MRMFGRFQLLRLLGKSERTMAWAVAAPGENAEWMLVLPRSQPIGAQALERWSDGVRRAARLNHPNLAPVVELGVHDGWPFAAYDLHERATLAERLSSKGMPGVELAPLAIQALQGLAFAHEGGVVHHDVQPYMMLVSDSGQLRVAGLEVAAEESAEGLEPGALRERRDAAGRDVLALGVLLHHALVGQAALDEPDTGRVISRLPPEGREIVRLAWTTAHPIPDVLRAIVNRSTDRQERQRYRNARTLARALEGWLQTEGAGQGGTIALLGDKLRAAGVLPSSPGAGAQAARLALMESERTIELAEVVLQDIALSFELLRNVNGAQVRGAQVSGNGPILTIRRAIAMLGLDGVRRAALALRPWPGPLDPRSAAELERLAQRVKRAGRVALALRPPGYDGEVVYLITMLQNLGRLVVQYHFADEAVQIRRLMQAAPSARAGEPDDPGMSEEAACYAVLGADIEAIGAAVVRSWGLDDSVLHMIRRLPPSAPVRHGDDDDEVLRLVASAANEAVDALAQAPAHVAPALHRVAQRYGRALGLTFKDLQQALQDVPRPTSNPTAPMPLQPEEPAAAGPRSRAMARAAR